MLAVLLKMRRVRVSLDIHEITDSSEAHLFFAPFIGRMALRYLCNFSSAIVHARENLEELTTLVPTKRLRARLVVLPLFDQYPRYEYQIAKARLGLDARKVVLSFGTIRAYKGIPVLVEAIALLPLDVRSSLVLAVVGGTWGHESTPILRRLMESPVSDQTILRADYIPDSEVGLWFSAADVVVQPYIRSSQSGVLRIAMQFGLDCIVTESEDARSMMAVYSGLHIVTKHDAAQLAKALEEVVSSQPRRHSRPPNMSWDHAANEYVAILDRFMGGQK